VTPPPSYSISFSPKPTIRVYVLIHISTSCVRAMYLFSYCETSGVLCSCE
jgi:hypothetical protein